MSPPYYLPGHPASPTDPPQIECPEAPRVPKSRFVQGPVFDPFLRPPFSHPWAPKVPPKIAKVRFLAFMGPIMAPFLLHFHLKNDSKNGVENEPKKSCFLGPSSLKNLVIPYAKCTFSKATSSRFGPENGTKMELEMTPFRAPFLIPFWIHFWTPSKTHFVRNRPAQRDPRGRQCEKRGPKMDPILGQSVKKTYVRSPKVS